jgi:cytochrome b involved in lipid metabolism
MAMAPPPNRAPTVERHMNDSTMPPPRFQNKQKQTAVNVRARGPRFGLHDWKRLLAGAKDLAQRKGAPLRRDITLAEVKQHNKVYDGWTILRGKVYNIGPYLAYHPGGEGILKGILGKDSTKLFDKYHRWVNVDGLVGPLLLGTVAMEAPSKANPFSVVPPKESHLINAPRMSPQAASGTSLLADNDSDDEEEQILPVP